MADEKSLGPLASVAQQIGQARGTQPFLITLSLIAASSLGAAFYMAAIGKVLLACLAGPLGLVLMGLAVGLFISGRRDADSHPIPAYVVVERDKMSLGGPSQFLEGQRGAEVAAQLLQGLHHPALTPPAGLIEGNGAPTLISPEQARQISLEARDRKDQQFAHLRGEMAKLSGPAQPVVARGLPPPEGEKKK